MFTSGDIIRQMPLVMGWLTDIGFNKANSSRYSRYQDHISEFYEPKMTGVSNENFVKVSKSLSECLDIVIIYKAFKMERSKGFIDRLSKAMSGADFLDKSLISESRDFLLELVVSAKFKTCGYEIDFDKLTDVVATKNGFTVYGECKRLSSLKQFENNFKKAGKQLKRKLLTKSDYHYGMIFLDISNPIMDSFLIVPVKNTFEAHRMVKLAVNDFENANNQLINHLNSRFIDSSLGVCLFGKAHIWTEPVELYCVNEYSIVTKPDLNDHLFKVIHILFRNFDNAGQHLFKDENSIINL